MSIVIPTIGIILACVLSYGLGYWFGRLAFGSKNASITHARYTDAEVYGACEGAILAEFGVPK